MQPSQTVKFGLQDLIQEIRQFMGNSKPLIEITITAGAASHRCSRWRTPAKQQGRTEQHVQKPQNMMLADEVREIEK